MIGFKNMNNEQLMNFLVAAVGAYKLAETRAAEIEHSDNGKAAVEAILSRMRMNGEWVEFKWDDDKTWPPEDTPVLVRSEYWPDDVTTASLVDGGEGYLWAQYAGYGMLSDKTCYEIDDDYQYTHWRHLPPLPQPPREG